MAVPISFFYYAVLNKNESLSGWFLISGSNLETVNLRHLALQWAHMGSIEDRTRDVGISGWQVCVCEGGCILWIKSKGGYFLLLTWEENEAVLVTWVILVLQTDLVLKEKRRVFIQSVSTGTINGLLDELLQKRVLNQEEMEKVRNENATVMDKARALIDSVIQKGPRASQICICYICEEDSHLAEKLGLSSGKVQFSFKFTRALCLCICIRFFHGPCQFADNSLCLKSVALLYVPISLFFILVP